jgi:hypothetical protein
MDMLKVMSVVVNFSGDEIKINLDIDNLRGINNITLNNSKQFTLKGTDNSDLNQYADLLIMECINLINAKSCNELQEIYQIGRSFRIKLKSF